MAVAFLDVVHCPQCPGGSGGDGGDVDELPYQISRQCAFHRNMPVRFRALRTLLGRLL